LEVTSHTPNHYQQITVTRLQVTKRFQTAPTYNKKDILFIIYYYYIYNIYIYYCNFVTLKENHCL